MRPTSLLLFALTICNISLHFELFAFRIKAVSGSSAFNGSGFDSGRRLSSYSNSNIESHFFAKIENALLRNIFTTDKDNSISATNLGEGEGGESRGCFDPASWSRDSFIQLVSTPVGSSSSPQAADLYGELNNRDFVVVSAFPTPDEVRIRENLPLTLSGSNKELGNEENQKLWPRTSGIFPLSHPRSNRSFCIEKTTEMAQKPRFFYNSYKTASALEPSYMISMKRAILNEKGIAATPCGYIQQMEACDLLDPKKGRNFQRLLMKSLKEDKIEWSSLFSPQNVKVSLPALGYYDIPHYDKVFVMSSPWDHNYYHMIHEVIYKLSRFLDLVKDNKDIKLHFIEHEKYVKFKHYSNGLTRKMYADVKKLQNGPVIRRSLLKLIGIDYDSRVISGPVLANQVYLPNEILCGFALNGAVELKRVANILLDRSKKWLASSRGTKCEAKVFRRGSKTVKSKAAKAKTIIIQGRVCPPDAESPHTKGKCSSFRYWSEKELNAIIERLSSHFPEHDIVTLESDSKPIDAKEVFSKSANSEFIYIEQPSVLKVDRSVDKLACDITQYAAADIVLGLHGAGLANAMFMKANSLVVEIAGEWDGRVMPLCGHYGPLAAAVGVHHYTYYFDGPKAETLGGEGLNITKVVSEIDSFYRQLKYMQTLMM